MYYKYAVNMLVYFCAQNDTLQDIIQTGPENVFVVPWRCDLNQS